MINDATIWQAVTDRITATLTGCEVRRTYDPEESLKGIEELGKTLVLVCLGGKVSTMQTQFTTRDDYQFTVFLVDYISGADATAEQAEMDSLLTLPPQIYDAFAYKTETVTEDGETIDLKLCAGSDFDVEFLTTHETFVACITMNVTTIRDITT